ncbi:type 2 isopentenyl-diphosphate Delta-isomerase [Candidatus Methanoliparum sp. LAM-1]|nr:type 2 isopentenyl-diphosphate Delta-isomerase [Candidatus Methanoliparum sp. LAM-1]
MVLIHDALPEIDKDDITIDKKFLSHDFKAPIIVNSITGGHPETEIVNKNIARAIELLGLGMSVGSQRSAIKDPSMERTFKIARKEAPTAFISSNIGVQQLKELTKTDIEQIIDMIDADAIFVHLNFLQESIQSEGNKNAEGCLDEIEKLCDMVNIPVIVKETGAGISRETCERLKDTKISAIDVEGSGGTSFSAVEYYRAKKEGNTILADLGKDFWNWGIPTPISLLECHDIINIPIIGGGGVRNGIDVAKVIALGADIAAIARPVVKPALKSDKEVLALLERYIEGLKITMFLTACRRLDELREIPIVITGYLNEYLTLRGIDVRKLAQRKRSRYGH